MNERQLADIAHEHRPDLPILFVTGYAEKAAARSRFLGTHMDLITKPFSLDVLAAKLRELLAHGSKVGRDKGDGTVGSLPSGYSSTSPSSIASSPRS